MPYAVHKPTWRKWQLMTRPGVIMTEQGDKDYEAGDVMLWRLEGGQRDGAITTDQYVVKPWDFLEDYDMPEDDSDLQKAQEFWRKNDTFGQMG